MESQTVFRAYRAGDEAAILRILKSRSGAACTLDEWSWLFPPEECGRLIVVGEEGGEVVAVCAGRPLQVQVRSREWAAVELHHVVASDDDDNASAVDAFVETCASGDRFALVLTTHAQAAEAGAGFVAAGRRCPVFVRIRPSSATLARLSYRAEPARDWEPRLDGLWKRARKSYPFAVVRDANRALRRFAAHPSVRYDRFVVCPRFANRVVASAVFALLDDCLRWVDLVWDHDHPGALDLLAFISGRLVGQLGAKREELWLAGDDEAPSLLMRAGFSPEESSTIPALAARSFVPELDAEEFVANTYLTLTDAWGLVP
jgi:hypothetical protein